MSKQSFKCHECPDNEFPCELSGDVEFVHPNHCPFVPTGTGIPAKWERQTQQNKEAV